MLLDSANFYLFAWTTSTNSRMAREELNYRQDSINPLLKIAIALALPLAGLIFSSSLTPKRTTRPKRAPHNKAHEWEDAAVLPETTTMDSTAQCSENPRSEVSIVQLQEEDIAEGEHSELEAQLHQNYCSAGEQELLFQKMQIMCLGFKLESMEAQNQRLEATIAKHQAALEQLDGIGAELRLVKKKVKKLSRTSMVHSTAVHQQALDLDAREAELWKVKEELTQAKEEIRDLAHQLQDWEKIEEMPILHASPNPSTSKVGEELLQVGSMKRLQNMELLDQLKLFQDKWHEDMEELIYLGCIGACLKHDLILMNQEEEGKEERDQLIMELPVVSSSDDHGQSCRVQLHELGVVNSPSSVAVDLGENNTNRTSAKGKLSSKKKPRLLYKIKRWAKGK